MKYLSLNEYMQKYNIGYDTALQILHSGKVNYIKTEGGHYKITDYNNDSISLKEYTKVVKENERLRTIIKSIYNISKEELNG